MSFSAKQLRTLDRHLSTLFGRKGAEPYSFKAASRLGERLLWYEFSSPDDRTVLLTEQGVAAFEAISASLRSERLVAFTTPADTVNSFRAVVKGLLGRGSAPESADSLVKLVAERLQASRRTYWHASPVHGLLLDKGASISLGCLTLELPSEQSLKQRGAKIGDTSIVDMIGSGPCLIGSLYGSEAFARQEFKYRVEVVIGVMMVVAAACFAQGATPFRITAEVSLAGMHSARRGISWDDESGGIQWSRASTEHQSLHVDAEMADFLQNTPYVVHALGLAARDNLSEIEEALLRGFFWFSDAQQDSLRVMQLIKYWSCAEVIFSGDRGVITKTVSDGVTSILVAGVQQEKPENFSRVAARLVGLYELRCDAVHGAQHDKVTYKDVVDLSRWTAWMLLGVSGLVKEMGYTSTTEVREQTKRLAGVYRTVAHESEL